MLRLPANGVDVAALKPYLTGERARLSKAGAFVVLDLWSEDDERGGEEEGFGGAKLAATCSQPLRSLPPERIDAFNRQHGRDRKAHSFQPPGALSAQLPSALQFMTYFGDISHAPPSRGSEDSHGIAQREHAGRDAGRAR